MKFAGFIFVGLISGLIAGSSYQPLPQAQSVVVEQQDDIRAFSISVEQLDTYVLDSDEEIKANGKRYLIADVAPKRVSVSLIITEGDHKNWLVVRRLSGGKSTKLTPFKPNQFLFEHAGKGEYEVTSLDTANEPVFDYFDVGVDKPDGPKPELPGYTDLIEVAQANANSDIETRKKLGTAWLAVVNSKPATISEAKKQIGKAREDILSFVRDQDGSWNRFLIAVDEWFKGKTLDQDQYLDAIKNLATWMQNGT